MPAKDDMATLVAHALRDDYEATLTTATKSSSEEDPSASHEGGAADENGDTYASARGVPDPRDASMPHDFDVGIEDLPELKRLWTGAFADPDVETLYRKEVFYPSLGKCMSHVLLWFAAFNSLSYVSLVAHGLGDELSVERHGWSANTLVLVFVLQLAFVFRTVHFCNMPMWLMEATSVAVLAAMALLLRYHQLLIPNDACSPHVTLMLRLGAFLSLTSAYVPLTLSYYVLVLTICVGLGGALDQLSGASDGTGSAIACPYNFGSLVLLGLSTTVCRCRLASVARGEWAFRRTVLLAQRERKRTHRQFERARASRLKVLRTQEKEKEALAEEAQCARSRLIRVVMHDMRSPLLSVLNVTKLLHGLGAHVKLGEERVLKALDALGACAALMENIVSDMLDFERIDSGRLVLVFQPFTVGKLLSDAHTTFEALGREKGVTLVAAAIDDELRNATWLGDRWRLQQCLNNGVSNAIKFTDPGGSIYLKAWLSQRNPRADEGLESVHIAVVDGGMGLTPEEVDKLNAGESFTQVGAGQLQGRGGTGLGVSITHSILKLHNDSKLVLSSMGEGTGSTFEMALFLKPTTQDTQHGATGSQCTSPRASRADSKAGSEHARDDGTPSLDASFSLAQPPGRLVFPDDFCCLHVEDDVFLQMTLPQVTFEALEAPWQTAKDGQHALDLVVQRMAEGLPPFQLIIMDNQMPRMNGIRAVRELRSRGYEGTIIGMTGDPTGSPDRAEFESSGLNMCVDKDSAGMESVNRAIRSFALKN